jgi:hypothetical protein
MPHAASISLLSSLLQPDNDARPTFLFGAGASFSSGISRLPITLLFARRVGELMSELSDNATPKSSYRFYI